MANMSMKIKQMREALDLSQVQLAEKAGLSAAAICQFENGSRTPSLKTLQELAKALGTPISYFLENEKIEEEFSPKDIAMFRGLKKLNKDDLDFISALYRTLKNQNKGKENR